MRRALIALALAWAALAAHAAPINPMRDDEVIEVLPATAGGARGEERRQREQLAKTPRDAALALGVARRELARAHELGDPRFAGMALAAIDGWRNDADAPADVMLMRATLQQYLHEFDAAAATLQKLLARPGSPQPQAWMTLATVRRVQGRYSDSDAACAQVSRAGSALYGMACQAENAALRGEFAQARSRLDGLLATPRLPGATRGWLLTTLAELEQRAARPNAADTAYRAALLADPDHYTRLAYADFLIEQRRAEQALTVLRSQPRGDAVLLRLAIAGAQARAPGAAADIAEMRERISMANDRPDAKRLHGREQAMFALWIDGAADRALELARGNVAQQREPIDLLVFAQAAHRSGRDSARDEVRRVVDAVGLRDERLRELL